MKNWLLSVSVAALVISVILLVIPKGKTSVTIKVIAGFLVSFVILQAVRMFPFTLIMQIQRIFCDHLIKFLNVQICRILNSELKYVKICG